MLSYTKSYKKMHPAIHTQQLRSRLGASQTSPVVASAAGKSHHLLRTWLLVDEKVACVIRAGPCEDLGQGKVLSGA